MLSVSTVSTSEDPIFFPLTTFASPLATLWMSVPFSPFQPKMAPSLHYNLSFRLFWVFFFFFLLFYFIYLFIFCGHVSQLAGSQFPDQGLKPSHRKPRILTTMIPGKSLQPQCWCHQESRPGGEHCSHWSPSPLGCAGIQLYRIRGQWLWGSVEWGVGACFGPFIFSLGKAL